MIGVLLLLLVCAIIAVPVAVTEAKVGDLTEFKNAFNLSKKVDITNVTGDIYAPNEERRLDGKNHRISNVKFTIYSSCYLTLGNSATDKKILMLESSFAMNSGLVSKYIGGGVYVWCGTFNRNGGSVTGNSPDDVVG